MPPLDTAKFISSDCYPGVVERLHMLAFNGASSEDSVIAQLNKEFKFDDPVHVINVIGVVFGCEIRSDLAESGQLGEANVCLFKVETRAQLQKIVDKMPCYKFSLIPLILVEANGDKYKSCHGTWLVKVGCTIIDENARVYATFEKFLKNNLYSLCIACYPLRPGSITVDCNGKLEVGCTLVGRGNSVMNGCDTLFGALGVLGAASALTVTTGGLAAPLAIGSSAYYAARSLFQLVDAKKHGASINPLQNAEARNHLLMMSANTLTLAAAGVKGLALAAAQSNRVVAANRLAVAGRIAKRVSAGVHTATMVDSVVFLGRHWDKLRIGDKIFLTASICINFREVISFANSERIIMNAQMKAVGQLVNTSIPSVASALLTDGNLRSTMYYLATLGYEKMSVTVSDDCTKILLFGFEYRVRNIIYMPEQDLRYLMRMLSSIKLVFKDLFILLRKSFDDESIQGIVKKRAEELGDISVYLGMAVNQLLHVFQVVKNVRVSAGNMELLIGTGHSFTLGSAFNIFVTRAKWKAVALVEALYQTNNSEAEHLNRFRSTWQPGEESVFEWILAETANANNMLKKIRFLLAIDQICSEKSLRITTLLPKGAVEVESLLKVELEDFSNFAVPYCYVDVRLFRICQPALGYHSDYISDIWKKACFSQESTDTCLDKLIVLEEAFKKYPFAVESVVSCASKRRCQNFPSFVYYALFLLSNLETQIESGDIDQATMRVNSQEEERCKSHFLELRNIAEERNLVGYCKVDENDLADPELLEAAVKSIAHKAELRFGTVENAVLQLYSKPSLRLRSEIVKYNSFIANKKFECRILSVAIGDRNKYLINLCNKHLQIIVGVVPGIGAYIDTFNFMF